MAQHKPFNLTPGERRMILDRLYDRFVTLGDQFNRPEIDRREKHRLRVERKALARLINKLEGSHEVDLAEEEKAN